MLTYVCTVFEECKSIWRTIVEQCIIKRGSSIIKYSIQTTQKTATFPPFFFLLFFFFFYLFQALNFVQCLVGIIAQSDYIVRRNIFDKTVHIFKNDLYIFYST